MNTRNITFEILKSHNMKAKKSLGQNFLIDDNILEEIVSKSDLSNEDIIIEIGPGLGNLTYYLLKKCKKVIAFEIDSDMIEILNNRFKYDNLELINKDILNVNIKDYVGNEKIKIVANLPYYITTPILFKLFEQSENISSIIVMVQKEVAKRIVSKPKSKEYGILTVGTNYYCKSDIIIDVPRESFIPVPNVDSSVLKMDIDKRYKVNDEKLFFELVKKAFSQRRKKVINSLESTKFLDMNKIMLEKLLERNNIDKNARAEEISIEKYVEIVNNI